MPERTYLNRRAEALVCDVDCEFARKRDYRNCRCCKRPSDFERGYTDVKSESVLFRVRMSMRRIRRRLLGR